MQRTGGSATIYGILYQILGGLRQALELTLDAQVQGDDIKSAQMVVEPVRGGDLVIDHGAYRIVEQWKSRRSGRRWTIREIISKVLPDLYRATDLHRLGSPATYRFQVEGEIADWEAARTFFKRLRAIDAECFAIDELDNGHATAFLPGPQGLLTEREFFVWIADRVGGNNGGRAEVETVSETHRRLCHLLAYFDVAAPRTIAELEREIDQYLTCWVDCIEDVVDKRHELCGRLMQVAKAGHAVIRPEEFLRQARLIAVPLTRWPDVRAKLNRQAYESACNLAHYDELLDVRPALPLSRSQPVLVIAGGSGHGKSWRLASQSLQTVDSASASVFFRARGNVDHDLQAAADIVWHLGFEHDSNISLGRLANRIRDCNPSLTLPWLQVLIDDVRSIEEVRGLIEQPWTEWGIRLAFTVPDQFGKWLADQNANPQIQIHHVERFSQTQLREYLRKADRDWTGIPADVRQHLRLPLLAKMYCQQNPNPSWRATSEYDVFAELWQTLQSHPFQINHPDDRAALRELAGSVLTPGAEYPWSLKQCRDTGLDSEAITRLEHLGWLSRENGRVAMYHNRLLNWAVAAALSERARFGGQEAVEEICRILREVLGHDAIVRDQFLGYVFMDFLWLLSSLDHPQRGNAHHVVRAIEEAWAPNGYPNELYKQSLPTIGQRITDAIVQRIRESNGINNDFLPNLAAAALSRIGNPGAAAAVESLLSEPSELAHEVAIRVLANHSTPKHLDKLWSIYKDLADESGQNEEHQSRRRMIENACTKALRACGPLSPEWLRGSISKDGRDHRSAVLLANVLASMQSLEAQRIWECTKDILVAGLQDGAESLARCIRRFRDESKVPLMTLWATSGQPQKSVPGFESLCLLAPQQALSVIEKIPAAQLGWWQGWFDTLYQASPDQTRLAIRRIMDRSPQDAADIGQVYRSRNQWMDIETLRALLSALDHFLDVDRETAQHIHHIDPLLGILGRVSNTDLLDEFQNLQDGSLEKKLSESACRWLTDPRHPHDSALRDVPKVLLRMGGLGLTRFINAQLRHDDLFISLRGIEWSPIRADFETIHLLAAITERENVPDDPPQHPSLQQSRAMEVLAALGANDRLVPAIVKNGADVHSIRFLRGGQPAMSDDALAVALDALRGDVAEVRQRTLFAIGIGGRCNLIPLVKSIIANVESTVEDRFGALWALYGLEASDDESVALYSGYLDNPKCRYVATLGLLQSGRSDARHRLVKELDKIDPDLPGGDGWLPAMLSKHDDTRSASVQFAWKTYRGKSFFHTSFRSLDLIELLGDVKDPEVIDCLLQEADPSERGLHVVGRRAVAIRVLHKLEPVAAYEAAVSWLAGNGRDRHFAPTLIVEFDPAEGIPLLCSRLIREENRLVRRAICVSLRHSAKQQNVESQVRDLLQGETDERHAAAEIIHWMGPDFLSEELTRMAQYETTEYTRRTLLAAIAAHDAERAAGPLLHALETAVGMDQWRLVDALFDLAQPEQLGRKVDPLWMGPASDRFSPYLQERTDERCSDAHKQIQKDLERIGDD